MERIIGPWAFGARFDLGHWLIGPVVIWRAGWKHVALGFGPLSFSVEWVRV